MFMTKLCAELAPTILTWTLSKKRNSCLVNFPVWEIRDFGRKQCKATWSLGSPIWSTKCPKNSEKCTIFETNRGSTAFHWTTSLKNFKLTAWNWNDFGSCSRAEAWRGFLRTLASQQDFSKCQNPNGFQMPGARLNHKPFVFGVELNIYKKKQRCLCLREERQAGAVRRAERRFLLISGAAVSIAPESVIDCHWLWVTCAGPARSRGRQSRGTIQGKQSSGGNPGGGNPGGGNAGGGNPGATEQDFRQRCYSEQSGPCTWITMPCSLSSKWSSRSTPVPCTTILHQRVQKALRKQLMKWSHDAALIRHR